MGSEMCIRDRVNARSLIPKLDELYLTCRSSNPQIVVITESWLKNDVPNEQLVIPGFGAPFRHDRLDGRRGGGVCVYVKEDFLVLPYLLLDRISPHLRNFT